jgi:DNA-binding response OmpR family regulator
MTPKLKDLSPEENARGVNFTLLVSPDGEDFRSLTSILEQDFWKVRGVRSFREAIQILDNAEQPVVVACERVLPDGSWKDLYHFLEVSLPNPPPFIVFSHHADESLWAEVLNLGGYDVLAKPFESTEVHRVMSMARRHGTECRAMVH